MVFQNNYMAIGLEGCSTHFRKGQWLTPCSVWCAEPGWQARDCVAKHLKHRYSQLAAGEFFSQYEIRLEPGLTNCERRRNGPTWPRTQITQSTSLWNKCLMSAFYALSLLLSSSRSTSKISVHMVDGSKAVSAHPI